MYDIKHIQCGGVAFRSVAPPRAGDLMRAADIRLLDGSTPEAGTIPQCGACLRWGGQYAPVDGFADCDTLQQ